MVHVNVKFDDKVAKGVIRGLSQLESYDLLARLNLHPFSEKALKFLKSVFPDSRKGSGSDSNVREFGMHLVQGWKANPILNGTTAGFDIVHTLARNDHAEAILESLDTGSRAYLYVTEGVTRLKNKAGGSYVADSTVIKHKSRKGKQYKKKTYEYINEVLMPQIGATIEQTVKRIFN